MPRILRTRALVLLAIGILGGTLVDSGGWMVAAQAKSPGSAAREMLAPELLEPAQLKALWQQTLPLKKGEKFAAVVLLGDRLYLRSDQNYLWSLDRAKGDVVFGRSIAPAGIPVLGLISHENELISVIGNQLVEFDAASGQQRRSSDLELSIVAPPARNSEFFYVGAADRRLHTLRASDLVQLFPVAADDTPLITTILAADDLVVFGTDAGHLIGMTPEAPKRLWQFKAPEAVAGPVIREGSSFYFASTDTNVYRVDIADGTTPTLAWKYQTEAVLDRAPRVTQGFVYQYAVGRGLTALVKQTGQAAWSLREGVDLLAEAGNTAYLITRFRTLVVMDNVTGRKLFSVNFAPVASHAANTTDARIYVADETGRVVCLEPTR